MSAGRVLLVAGFVALSVAGCQAGGTAAPAASVSVSASPGPSSVTSVTSVPTSAGGAPSVQPTPHPVPPPAAGGSPPPTGPETPVPAAQVETAGAPTNPPNGVATTAGGRAVVFTVEQSGCQHVSAQVTGETPTSVAILVETVVAAKPGQMCPMIVREVLVTVHLAAPLGSRKIVFSAVTKHG